jgi:SAM-dependent methyltransferase
MWRGDVVPGSTSRLATVDHRETYGRHVLEARLRDLAPTVCVDLGCGMGFDLATVRAVHPACALHGVDFGDHNAERLRAQGVTLHVADIERDRLPFADASVDLVIANQVLEHTKEMFWILHEVFRVLRPGGHLYIGVPNLLSLHNRVLMAFGGHPTQHKLHSAHVRVFSPRDVQAFFAAVAPGVARVAGPWGAQFYPFPKVMARPLATVFPGLAFSIFFLVQRTGAYDGAFLRWPAHASLETNFRTSAG